MEDAAKVKEVMTKENLNWRTFVDKGPIGEKWKPTGTPAFYIIDHKGVIRYKWPGAPGAKAMDAALEKVIQEAEKDAKKPPK
ncbi:MAG TPA: hypothetical protein VKE74_31210 [Gemmataceae bacterium]|nr:hypothetical protein [Gemmataceae bacterium]